MRLFLILASALALVSSAFATTYASNGTQADVQAKINGASAGDTVTIPATGGPFTWGAGATGITMNKAIHLTNLGSTVLLSTSGPVFGSAVINMTGNGGWIDGTWTMTGAYNPAGPGAPVTPISASGTNFVVTGVHYTTSSTLGGYFVYVSEGAGVCYNCTLTAAGPSFQIFMIRGATSRWNNANTMGTSDAWYIEDSILDSDYAQENDGAAAAVVRFCTLKSGASLDMHQIETSTDANGAVHGSRQLEAYDNTYITAGYPQWLNARGGSAMIFDNVVPADGSGGGSHYFALIFEWGAVTNGSTIPGYGWQPTPARYPIPDQVGIGPYIAGVQTGGADPMYYWNNTQVGGADEPLLGYNPQSASAISTYGQTFYATDEDGTPYLYKRHREYFRGVAGGVFPSGTDVGRGTKAAMLASAPTIAGQGWWVTDEGSWNTKLAANTSGRLYKWSGSTWNLFYTPYTYPHPLQGTSPSLATATINSAGTTLTLTWTASCTNGTDGYAGMTISASGGAAALSSPSGSGSSSYSWTIGRTILAGEIVTVTYAQPGAGIQATSNAANVANFGPSSVTNNSTQSSGATINNPYPSRINAGPF